MGEELAKSAIIFICVWGLALVGYVLYINIFGMGKPYWRGKNGRKKKTKSGI